MTGRRITGQGEAQGGYHHERFHALHEARSWHEVLDLVGDRERARMLALDQLGHFGAQGCGLVTAELARLPAPPAGLELVELGAGFGGALRQAVAELRSRGAPVRQAIGVDLVAEHVRAFAAIGRAEGSDAVPVLGDVHALPLRDASVHAVLCTGSVPHFADPGRVLAEARRVLRPGGALVMTEEVSLLAPGAAPTPEFLRRHPPGIFFQCEVGERERQLRAAGFTGARIEDRTSWALGLLRDRIKVMGLFTGDVAEVFGEAEASDLRETLAAARAEILRGALVPALVTARAPG